MNDMFLIHTGRTNGFLMSHPPIERGIVRKFYCIDNFHLSIQASSYHYCEPRQDQGPWEMVEVGFPSIEDPFLVDGLEEPGSKQEVIFPYVSVELIDTLIAAREAAHLLSRQNERMVLLVEYLRHFGVIRTDSEDANTWTVEERCALAHAWALTTMFD